MTTRPTSDLTTWATSGTITEPSSPEKAAGFVPLDTVPAQWLNYFLSNLGLWAGYLDTEKLQSVDHTDASIPVFGVADGSSAHDQPGSPSNRWKLILRMPLSDATYARLYAGEGSPGASSQWCITTNASFDPSPLGGTGQLWTRDVSSKEANLLRCVSGELHWYGRATGTGHFTDDDWALSNRGNLKVGDTISCGDLHTTDDIQVGDRIDAAGDIAAGNDLTAVQFARIGGEYRYTSAKARNTIIPLASAYGAVFKNFQSYLVMGGSDTVSIAVKLPHGAILNSVDVMYSKAGTASVDVYAVRRSGANWTTATPPTNTQVGHTFSTAGIGNYVINVPFGGLTISKDEDYEVVVSDGDSGDHLHGFRVNWTDPGPQNF